jgi:hypothetical protein
MLSRSTAPAWTPSPHLDNDFPLGSTLLKIRKRLLRLFERKYLVDHRPNAPRFKKLADLCELTTVWVHEQERIRDAALLRAANNLAGCALATSGSVQIQPLARIPKATNGE